MKVEFTQIGSNGTLKTAILYQKDDVLSVKSNKGHIVSFVDSVEAFLAMFGYRMINADNNLFFSFIDSVCNKNFDSILFVVNENNSNEPVINTYLLYNDEFIQADNNFKIA